MEKDFLTYKQLWETIEWLNSELEKTKTSINADQSKGKILNDIPREFERQLINTIESGLFIQAIKDYRALSGKNLKDAKYGCDRLRMYMSSFGYLQEKTIERAKALASIETA